MESKLKSELIPILTRNPNNSPVILCANKANILNNYSAFVGVEDNGIPLPAHKIITEGTALDLVSLQRKLFITLLLVLKLEMRGKSLANSPLGGAMSPPSK